MNETPSFRPYIIPTLLLVLVGWGGLILILFIYKIPPLVWARWGFYVLATMGLTGTALPVVYFFHRRFPDPVPAESNIIIRQSLWVGIYGMTLAWLQLGRLVTIYVVLGLAIGLTLVEYLLRLREKARWKPPVHEVHEAQPPAQESNEQPS